MSVNNLQLCADPKASKDTKYVRQNNDDFDAKKKMFWVWMPKTSRTFLTVKVCSEVQQDKSFKVEKAALHEGMFVRI